MSFRDIFKKGFLTSYANTEITFRYAVLAMLVCLAIALVICAVYYFKSRKYFFSKEFAVSLVALSALLTGLSVYDDIAKIAGAGTLVPITGFANAVAAPAVEFKTEGFILGVGAKMFTIAGPVIVYGVSASAVYGLIYWITTLF